MKFLPVLTRVLDGSSLITANPPFGNALTYSKDEVFFIQARQTAAAPQTDPAEITDVA
ncbi:MAG TPA: hypothetical protein VFP84_18760 [Kofleriaceae bacterium]|nr:hypothetical protein [Kofleriaceae bacterium]